MLLVETQNSGDRRQFKFLPILHCIACFFLLNISCCKLFSEHFFFKLHLCVVWDARKEESTKAWNLFPNQVSAGPTACTENVLYCPNRATTVHFNSMIYSGSHSLHNWMWNINLYMFHLKMNIHTCTINIPGWLVLFCV